MNKARILVVDDEPEIVDMLLFNLLNEGYIVDSVGTGEAALQYARTQSSDLILLDFMLPGIDGIDVLRLLKSDKKTKDIMVIMLTARGSEEDIVTGLEIGAADYITKPFSLKVLNARIKAVINRHIAEDDPSQNKLIVIDSLTIDAQRHSVCVDGVKVALTMTEFMILHFLAMRPGWVFTRTQIINSVKGNDYPATDRAVDVQILNVRKKLKHAGKLIETVRGVGYRLREITPQ
ncbi:response regulator transcription factor [bacterium]|nr:response regulator transcription factor [bacterium]